MIRGLNKIVASPGLGYLMSTYTSHPGGFDEAEKDATAIAASLTLAGLVVFAPITYGPAIERAMATPMDMPEDTAYLKSHEFWMPICERFYARCDYGIVAMTPGWHQSKGIAIEVYALSRLNVPIHFLDIDEMHVWNMGEAVERYKEECEALYQLAAQLGIPHYLSEFVEQQSEAAAMAISTRQLEKIMDTVDARKK